ncbi:MAG: SDR family oxidoreductase [Planctomycetota bacterium]
MSRLVVITGATKGCGYAMARLFAAEGHRVFGCGRTVRDQPAGVTLSSVDVADDDAVANWSREVLSEGVPDLLINNAAIINRPAPLWDLSAAEFDQLIHINVCGTMNCVRHFVPAMIEAGSGVIVNFSSGWGRSTAAEVGSYCTSKWAIEGFSGSLAQDLPTGLASVAVNPGIINTEMLQTCWGDGASSFPDPESWAKKAVPFFLGLDAGDNGQAVTCP